MDGASKFVKGDAIAGIIILLINIFAGWIIGVAQMGMGWNEALQHFTLLTIGDGIVTQVPALIISIATGIIVTRSSADRELSTEVFSQLASVPRIPLIVAGMLTLLLLLPGMPKWPIVLLVGFSAYAWLHMRRKAAATAQDSADAAAEESAPSEKFAAVSVALGRGLAETWRPGEAAIMDRIASLRDAQEHALGVAFPPIKLIDAAQLGEFEYEIRLFGARYADGEIRPAHVLAIKGERTKKRIAGIETTDPAFGLPALWIEESNADEAREAGYAIIDPITVFATHLGEVLRNEAASLLTRAAAAAMLEEVRARQLGLVEELTPNLLSVSDVQRILQNLLSEGVSIAAIDLIAEHLVDLARTEKDIGALTELLRQRIAHVICNKLRDRHRDLAVLSLDPRLENQIQSAIASAQRRDASAIDPRLADRLIRALAGHANDMLRLGREPVLLCGGDIRRHLRALTRRSIPKLSVLSVNEIPMNIELVSHAIVRLEEEARKAPAARTDLADLQLGAPDGIQLQ